MKTIDTKSYLNTLVNLIEDNKSVSTIVTGGSMLPFLGSNRDYVYLEKVNREFKKGDIVLFIRKDENYVLHRIVKVKKEGYYLCGDSQNVLEGPVSSQDIKALVTHVKRKGKIICEKDFIWKFYSKIWINVIYIRPLIFKVRGFLKKT